jgi:lipopolysaccharide export system protein LptA
MPPLFRECRSVLWALGFVIASAPLPSAVAATIPAGSIDFQFDGPFRLGTGGNEVAGEQITITQGASTSIKADKAEGSWPDTKSNSHWKLTGNVHIEYDGSVLDAESATVVFANRLVESIAVHGAPAKFSNPGKPAGRPLNGTAAVITFDGAKRVVRFTGRSWFARAGVGEGTSVMPLVYELDTGVLRSESGAGPAEPIDIAYSENGRIDVRFDAGFSLGTSDDTMAGEQVTISQDEGALIKAGRARGNWTGTVADSRWMLTGKVHIEYQNMVLDSSNATVVLVGQRIKSIKVQDGPAQFSRPTGAAHEIFRGATDTITFDNDKRQVRFTGHTAYSFGQYDGTADQPLVYELDTGSVYSEMADGEHTLINLNFHPERRVPPPRKPERSSAQ